MDCPVCNATAHQPYGSKDGYDLFECLECGLVHVFPLPSDEVLQAFYDDYHKSTQYARKAESKTRRARNRIRRLRRRVVGDRFIDIGCNAGFAVEAARSLGWQACGIDIDSVAIQSAKALFAQAQFREVSVQALAGEGAQFDLIYCSEVIEHLPELDSFLGAVGRLMEDESVLYLTTPDLGHYTLRWPFWRQPLLAWDAIRPPEHLLYFSKNNLRQLLAHHGFSRVQFQFSLQPTIKAVIQK